jgi:anti-sigma regulatory factor (Ser/Thr protein kinase)
MKNLIKINFPNTEVSLQIADEIFNVIANLVTFNQQKIYHIRMALSELFNNAYLHADQQNRDSDIEFEACFSEDRFFASIVNKGAGFVEENYDGDEFPSGFAESGRGLKIVRKICDKVEFKRLANNKFGVFIEVAIPINKSVITT